MNRNVWTVAGVFVFALAVLNILLGTYLVPSMAVAEQKGTLAGWWLIWVVIAISVMSAVSLGCFLIAAGLGKVPETARRV